MEKHLSSKLTLWLGAILVGATLWGCTDTLADAKTTAKTPQAVYIAVDTSESARPMHKQFFNQISEELSSLPMSAHVEVFRFDSRPAEVYSGQPTDTKEEATMMLKRVLEHHTETEGTNLAKLLNEIDNRIKNNGDNRAVEVYTDCGIEKMTAAEKDQVRTLTKRWSDDPSFVKLSLIGVRDGFREELRKMLDLDESKLEIK